MIEKESGLYLFFQYCWRSNAWILITGRCEDKESRLGDYRVGLASTEFDYFIPTPKNKLKSHEKKLQKLLAESYPTHKNSIEQFVIGDTVDERDSAMSFLSEDMKLPINEPSPQKLHEYYRATLDGDVIDTRDFRPKCDLIPGETAQLNNKVNEPNKFRPMKTYVTLEGNKLIEHATEQTINACVLAHNIIRLFRADKKVREKLNTPIPNQFMK